MPCASRRSARSVMSLSHSRMLSAYAPAAIRRRRATHVRTSCSEDDVAPRANPPHVALARKIRPIRRRQGQRTRSPRDISLRLNRPGMANIIRPATLAVRFDACPGLAVDRFHRPSRHSRARFRPVAQGQSRPGRRRARGGPPALVCMGVRASDVDDGLHHRNRSAPQRSRCPRQHDRRPIHLHAQPVRPGARADQRRLRGGG